LRPLAQTESNDAHQGPSLLSRRRLLQGGLSCATSALLAGCGYRGLSINQSALGNTSSTDLNALNVGAGAIGKIPPRFLGLSYEKLSITYNYFHPSNYNLISLFRLLGAGVLRLGGSSVDTLLWTGDVTGTHQQVTAANITNLAAFLNATGWLCIYGVNLATSTPALAAQEVAVAVSALGANLLGIELGNEPDEYATKGTFFPANWTFLDFASLWSSFRSAIVQVAPNVPVTGPATAGGNHITSWTLAFGQTVTPSELVLLTQHYYRDSGNSENATASFLESPDSQLAGDLALLNPGAQQLGLPYRIDECNSFYDGGAPGVSNSYASSLWVIDFLFDSVLGGASGVNMHGGGNALYTPIADDSGGVTDVRPEYYGLLLFALIGPGMLLPTQLSAGGLDATAYAVRSASGGLKVIVVNKDTQDLPLAIEANQTISSATLQLMTGPSLAALSGVTIQGSTVEINGSFAPANPDALTPVGTQTTCMIPALSAGLISIT
jgi:hypothetical protein